MQADWSLAEAQVSNPAKSTVVSVKATGNLVGQKRKAEIISSSDATAGGKEKKNRRSTKKSKH